jgi:multidrug efflux pump subunit AcrA (membrane-fusion protein)
MFTPYLKRLTPCLAGLLALAPWAAGPVAGQTSAPARRGVVTVVESGAAGLVAEEVRTKRAGTIVALFVKPGDRVAKGQMLGHTELDQARFQMETARANLDARGQEDQMFWQHRAWMATREEIAEAVRKREAKKTRLEYAEAMGNWAEAQLRAQQEARKLRAIQFDYYKNDYEARILRAPIDGHVTGVKVKVGQSVSIALHAFTVSDADKISVPLTLTAALAAAAMEAGTLPVRLQGQKQSTRAEVAEIADDPTAPGERKIVRLLVNRAEVAEDPGTPADGRKFDVLVPGTTNTIGEAGRD